MKQALDQKTINGLESCGWTITNTVQNWLRYPAPPRKESQSLQRVNCDTLRVLRTPIGNKKALAVFVVARDHSRQCTTQFSGCHEVPAAVLPLGCLDLAPPSDFHLLYLQSWNRHLVIIIFRMTLKLKTGAGLGSQIWTLRYTVKKRLAIHIDLAGLNRPGCD